MGFLDAIPLIGPIISGVGSIISGANQMGVANDQRQQAARIRQDALNTQKQPLRPEYLAALHMAQMRNLSGLPGMEQYKNNLSQQVADQIRYIRMASPSGNATLEAMGNAVANQNQGLNNLTAQDEQYRSNALLNTQNTLWNIGDKQRDLENIRDTQRQQGLTAAAQMENASMLNKERGFDTITGGITGGANSVFGNLLRQDAAKTDQNNTEWLQNWLSKSSPGQSPTSADFFGNSSGGGNTGIGYVPPQLSYTNPIGQY